jgi:sigma-E factor negative regulatory protein RseA
MKQSNEISNMNQSTQQPQSEISAWMDGDRDADMPEHVLSAQGKSTWELYHLIGDTLRTPALALPAKHSLQQRVAQAIAQEPAIVAAPKPTASPVSASAAKVAGGGRFWGRTMWPGFAMAAAVASVIWVAKPFLLPELSSPVEQVAEVTTVQPVRPIEVAFNAPVVRDYVNTHREMSGPANVRQVSFGAMR